MKWLILLLLLIPVASAYDVYISLNSNDIVSEHFRIDVEENYSSYEFYIPSRPIGVIYEGDYSIQDNKIIFYDNSDILDFTLIYDDMIEKSRNGKNFRASFDKADEIAVALPEKHILSEDPATIPEPKVITSDGERIILKWDNTNKIAVFYEGENTNFFLITALFLLFLIAVSALFFHYSKKRVQDKLNEILSTDENLILSQLKKGVVKQKDIAKNLNFSKSKMSKVIRKLEEKKLIEKKPHFKTNIIKLKKI